MSKFCPKCGNENLDEASFCSKCGSRLPSIEEIRQRVPHEDNQDVEDNAKIETHSSPSSSSSNEDNKNINKKSEIDACFSYMNEDEFKNDSDIHKKEHKSDSSSLNNNVESNSISADSLDIQESSDNNVIKDVQIETSPLATKKNDNSLAKVCCLAFIILFIIAMIGHF